jgi:bifunctional DNase/RNase
MYSEIPEDSEVLRNLLPASNLELIKIDFYKVTVDQQNGSVIALFSSPDKVLGIEFNAIEGTMLTFTASGCYDNSHLRTIYHLYVETMQMIKFKLQKVVIESRQGDIIYARLFWQDHKSRNVFKRCSAGDAVVLAVMCDVDIYITKNVYDDLEDYTEYDEKLKDEYE